MLVKAALMTGLWTTYLYTMTNNNKKTTKQHIYTQQNKNNSLPPPKKKLKVTIISCQGSEVILVEQK